MGFLADDRGSPGRVNSVAEGRSDVSLDFIEQPDTLLAAEIPTRVRLQKVGLQCLIGPR